VCVCIIFVKPVYKSHVRCRRLLYIRSHLHSTVCILYIIYRYIMYVSVRINVYSCGFFSLLLHRFFKQINVRVQCVYIGIFYCTVHILYVILYYIMIAQSQTLKHIVFCLRILENATCHARMYYDSHWCYTENMPNSKI